MKLLIDMNLSPQWVSVLENAGWESDLNSFLKWEQLGKSNDSTPLLNNLLAQYKIALKGGIGGQPKYRDMIKSIILTSNTVE